VVAQGKVFGDVVPLKKSARKMHVGKLMHMLNRRPMRHIVKRVLEIEADIFLLVLLMNFRLLVVLFGSDMSKFLKV
jgi:hypothetical protein